MARATRIWSGSKGPRRGSMTSWRRNNRTGVKVCHGVGGMFAAAQSSSYRTRRLNYDEIVRVAQLYVDGFNDNDVSKFREAFHEDAWIFYIDAEGGPHKNLISENFEERAPPPSSRIVGRIISGATGGRCCLGPAQLRPQGQALWMNRL